VLICSFKEAFHFPHKRLLLALNFAELYYVNFFFFFFLSGKKTFLDPQQGEAQRQAEQGSPSHAGERCLGFTTLPGSPPQQLLLDACLH